MTNYKDSKNFKTVLKIYLLVQQMFVSIKIKKELDEEN